MKFNSKTNFRRSGSVKQNDGTRLFVSIGALIALIFFSAAGFARDGGGCSIPNKFVVSRNKILLNAAWNNGDTVQRPFSPFMGFSRPTGEEQWQEAFGTKCLLGFVLETSDGQIAEIRRWELNEYGPIVRADLINSKGKVDVKIEFRDNTGWSKLDSSTALPFVPVLERRLTFGKKDRSIAEKLVRKLNDGTGGLLIDYGYREISEIFFISDLEAPVDLRPFLLK